MSTATSPQPLPARSAASTAPRPALPDEPASAVSPQRLASLREHLGPRLGDALEGAYRIAQRAGTDHHDALVVLGSGADAALAAWGEPAATQPLSDLPGVLAPVAPGHVDRLSSYVRPGAHGLVRVLVAHGRTHLYEGHGPGPVSALARIAAAAGVRAAVLTNANGCLRPWELGDVVTVTDHLNLTGTSPFDGPDFLDVRATWDPGLVGRLTPLTQRAGTYACLRGPEYQTLAESRMLAGLGADVVGMSTVPEALTLHQLGVRVAGMSVVSDLSLADTPTDPDAVVALAAQAGPVLVRGVEAVLATL